GQLGPPRGPLGRFGARGRTSATMYSDAEARPGQGRRPDARGASRSRFPLALRPDAAGPGGGAGRPHAGRALPPPPPGHGSPRSDARSRYGPPPEHRPPGPERRGSRPRPRRPPQRTAARGPQPRAPPGPPPQDRVSVLHVDSAVVFRTRREVD